MNTTLKIKKKIQTCGGLVLPGPEDLTEALWDKLLCRLLSKTLSAPLMDFGFNSLFG